MSDSVTKTNIIFFFFAGAAAVCLCTRQGREKDGQCRKGESQNQKKEQD